MRRVPSLLVALSGGVDSAVLLKLSIEAIGADRVLAVTGHSASLAQDDLGDARAVARMLGARHEVVETREIDREAYRANAGDRCYHCRTELFEHLGRVARERGLAAIAYGAIADDAVDVRPGMRAATEHAVLAPLAEAGFTKSDVRAIARDAELPVRDKPAAACLASRIPVGTPVSSERLAAVESAEAALRGLGLGVVRVRHHGDIARVEVDADGEALLLEPRTRRLAIEAVRAAGFRFAVLDLEGYRSGGAVAAPDLYRIGPIDPTGQ